MEPIYLSIKDFMNHGDSEIDFSKLAKASVIVGIKNNSEGKSNAVGKTNIFNAIKYVLFNSKVASTKERTIRDGTKKCQVIFEFKTSNGIYKIERYKTKTSQGVKFYKKDDDWIDISKKTVEQTDVAIVEALSINEKTFENSSYLKQNDYEKRKVNALAAATQEERKSIIMDLLQLNVWNKYQKKAKDLRDNADQALSLCSSKLDALGNPSKDIDDLLSNIKDIDDQTVVIDSNIVVTQNKFDEIKQEIEATKLLLSDEYPDLIKKYNEEFSYCKKIYSELDDLKSKVLLKKQLLDKYEEEIISKSNKLVETQNKFNSENSKQINKPEEAVFNELLNKISKLNTIIRETNSELSFISKPIPKGQFCNECGTELNEEHRHSLKTKKIVKATELNSIITNNNEELKQLLDQKTKIEKDISNYNLLEKNIDKLQKEIQSLEENIIKIQNNINFSKETIKSLDDDIVLKEKQYKEAQEKCNELKSKADAIDNKSIENKIAKLNKENAILSSELKQLSNKKDQFIYNKGKYENILKTKQEDVSKQKELLNEKKQLGYKLQIYKACFSCFGSSGVPAMIIYSVVGSIQDETNKMLEMMDSDMQVQFIISKQKDDGTKADALDIRYFVNGAEFCFGDLSGGQQAIIVATMKLAIASISRKRCGADIRLLLLDEVEQALDGDSVNQYYQIIKTLSKEMTILIITHNNELKKKFDSIITVKQTNGVSTIEVNGE